MTPLLFAVVCAAGGVGAALRFVVDGWVRSRVRTGFPLATAVVNLSGSFLLGLLSGLVLARVLPTAWGSALGTGLLGGYTTFSTASVETLRLLQAGEGRTALASGLGVLVGGVLAALLGWRLGSVL